MNDKPFDPVTEGTPEDVVRAIWRTHSLKQAEPLIAARDAAMRNLGRLDMMQDYGVTEEPEAIALARTWTPEQLFQQWENAFYAVRILTEEITREREHRASAERRGRLKGMDEAALLVENFKPPAGSWHPSAALSTAADAIRAAAETAKEGGDV